jgi:two-component system KDP operon response regulator KdpE
MSEPKSIPLAEKGHRGILVVEDDYAIRRFLRISLVNSGYTYYEATTAAAAIPMLKTPDIAAVVLDLGLPDRDGVDLLRDIRVLHPAPVIVISARGQEHSKIEALDAGADDYLTKPFGYGELLARLRAVFRRQAPRRSGETIFTVGPIQVNIERHEATLHGEKLILTPREFKLLEVLIQRPGRVLTHRFLLREVWGAGHGDQTHYVRIYMNSLRHKLQRNDTEPSYISTEIGVGYRLRDELQS